MALLRVGVLWVVAALASEDACEGEGECLWKQVGEWKSDDTFVHELNNDVDQLYETIEEEPTLQDDENFAPQTWEVCSGTRTKGCVKPADLPRLLKKAVQPIIVQGLIDGWPQNLSWSKQRVLENYGGLTVTVSLGSLYPTEGGKPERQVRVSLKDLIQRFLPDSRFVSFDRLPQDVHSRFLSSKLLSRMATATESVPILSAGGPRSGIPWHTHGKSSLLCYVGTKRWFTFPPGTANVKKRGHPFLGSLNWTRAVLPNLQPEERPVTFLQRPGEFVYLPAAWPHLTLNLDDSLCVGWQEFLENDDLPQLIPSCSASAPRDPDACTLLGVYCRDVTCPFSREDKEFFDDALRVLPLHLAAAGHAAEFDTSRAEATAAVLMEQEPELLQEPLVDNLTIAYGWIFLAQTLYNKGGDHDTADAFLSHVGPLVLGDDLAMEALALYDKTNGTKSFDYSHDFNESNDTLERRERRGKQKRGKGA
ncbi:JMJD8 [Symbiodinium natans]|uniref:JMJD8 protein n=1 Tax=Symbiodinium natans TaxID=878477 RepID=A0A812U742_9DINO|nr:JMJD8 [Symbiodinium natans]